MGWHLALNSVIGLSTWKKNRNKHSTWCLRLGPWKVWEWVAEKGLKQIKPKLILAKYGNGTNKYIGTCQNAPPSGWYIDRLSYTSKTWGYSPGICHQEHHPMRYNHFRHICLAHSSSLNSVSSQTGKNCQSYGQFFVCLAQKHADIHCCTGQDMLCCKFALLPRHL